MTGYLKTTMAAALLCGAAVLAAPAYGAGMSANTSIGNSVGTAQPDQAHPSNASNSQADMNDGSDSDADNDGDNDNDMASDENDDSDQQASNEDERGSLHGRSTPAERAETRDLNQQQLAANGHGNRAGVTGHGAVGQAQGGVASHTSTSAHSNDMSDDQDQDNDADESQDSDDTNGQ